MSIQLTCPSGHTLTVADAWAGRSGRCPVCKAPVQVPAVSLECGPGAPGSPFSISIPATLNKKKPEPVAVLEKAPALQESPEPAAASIPTMKTPPPLSARAPDSAPTPPAVIVAPSSGAPGPPASAGKLRAFPTERTSRTAPAKERTSQQSLPLQSTPPPLPVVVATSVVAISQPPAVSATPINGSVQVTGLAPSARKNIDAVFENIAVEFDSCHRATNEARSDISLPTLVAEVEPAATPIVAAPLPPELFDPVIRQKATGYQPDADKRRTVYYLAAAMAALSLYCMGPAVTYLDLGSAPNWARAALLLSLLQLAYAAWVASMPDWATLRSSMIIFTVIAALYGLTMTVALSTPAENRLPLDLTEVRRQAVLWCAGVVLLASLLAYGCGRAAWRWRRTIELLHA